MDNKAVRIFDLSFDEEFRKKFHQGVEQIFDEAFLTDHTFVKKFEQDFSKTFKSTYSLAVSHGTAAIELALRALSVRGKKVILPTNTFIATAVAVLNAGGIPCFLDIELDYFGLHPKELENHLGSDVAAVIVVHIGGHVSTHFEKIKKICDSYSIPIVEDAAHAHGALYQGKYAGTLGTFGAFSHFMTKIMTTGEGGTVTCQQPELFDLAFSIRRFGHDPQHSIHHVREGANFKMSEFQGLMGVLELERIKARIEQRRQLALRYQANLAGSAWLCVKDNHESVGSYYKQIVISPIARSTVQKKMLEKGIALTGGVFFLPLHRQQSLNSFFFHRTFSNADHFADSHICPPCYPELKVADVDRVCECLLELAR